MQDWDEERVNRKNFRRSKDQPEIAKHRGQNKKGQKKKFKLVVKNWKWSHNVKREDYVLGKYERRVQAEQARQNQQTDYFWKECELKIEEI